MKISEFISEIKLPGERTVPEKESDYLGREEIERRGFTDAKKKKKLEKKTLTPKGPAHQGDTTEITNHMDEAVSAHAIERIAKRMRELGYKIEQARKIFQTSRQAAAESGLSGSEAVRITVLKDIHGTPWSDESNGNEIWAIIRSGDLVTVMFRRSTQPSTPEALRVDRVRFLDIEV